MKKTILLFLLFFNITYFAQNKKCITYTYGEKVLAIVDANEVLWLGTDGGLVKFDKKSEKKTFYNKANTHNGLMDNHILALAIDSLENLWVGTQHGGVSKFDGENWQNFMPSNSNLPYEYISCISVAPNNNIYLGSGDYFSIYNYNKDYFTNAELGVPHLSHFDFFDIEFETNGNAWIATTHGLFTLQNNVIKKIKNDTTNFITSIAIDKNENIWFGTQGMGLLVYNKEYFAIHDTINSNVPGNNIYIHKFDKDGNLWCSINGLLWKYDNQDWIEFKPNILLPKDQFIPFRIVIDENGSLWIATIEQGLIKYDGIKWKKFGTSNSPLFNNFPNLVAVDNKGIAWITHYQPRDSVISYDGNNWQVHQREDQNFWSTNFNMFYTSDTTQVLTGNDIIVEFYTPENWVGVFNSKNKSNSSYIQLDYSNNLWQVSRKGLWRYDGNSWTLFNKNNTPIAFNKTYFLLFDNQNKLYALSDVGLIIYDEQNWSLIDESFFLSDTIKHALTSMCFDKFGNLWLGSGATELEFKVKQDEELIKWDGTSITRYNKTNSGFTGHTIYDLDFDSNNNLWIATDDGGGLIKFDCKNEWTVYNSENSGIFAEFEIYPLEIDKYDNKWFASWWGGITVFNENGIITDITKKESNENFINFLLLQNYPNPFNLNTTINYTIPAANGSPTGMKQSNEVTSRNSFSLNDAARVTLKVYDVLGREIKTLVNKKQKSGNYKVEFNAGNLPSGIYFYRLSTGSFAKTKKMILLK